MQDILTVSLLAFISALILCGLTFSTIVTTNAYCGPQKIIEIKEPIIRYEPYITKNGRLRHYIRFINPTDNQIINLEVYRKYSVGELFIKEMKIGKWGQLYSID